MSRDLPQYDKYALDEGDTHQCAYLSVRCWFCLRMTCLRSCDAVIGARCFECDAFLTKADLDRAECACGNRDDDERKERRS